MKITLIGSMIFMGKMNEIKSTLETFGHSVVSPALTQEEVKTGVDTFMDYVDAQGGVEKVLPDNAIWKIKEESMKAYKKNLDEADLVLVCNFDKGEKKNRVGDNTFLEMGYSFFLGKKIYVLQGPPHGDEKIEEVLGMRPVFLYGDVERLEVIQ